MFIEFLGYRIKNHKPYAYVVQKKVGAQWKKPSYHLSLETACEEVFDRKLRQIEIGVSDTESTDKVQKALDRIIFEINSAKAEIIKAVADARC